MTAAWVVYIACWSALLALGAAVVDRVLRRGQAPLRLVWAAALVLSVAGPAIGYSLPRAVRLPSPAPATSNTTADFATLPVLTIGTVAVAAPHPESSVNILAIGWIVTSSAMLLYLIGGFTHLYQLRRRWVRTTVGETAVMVSDSTGPAVVGVVRGTIVLPRWVLALDERRLALVVRHEREHQRAGDALLLSLAQLVLVAAPWNPLVWWQLRRLRLAIEVDCDARVLRAEPDVRSYGNVLLEVGRPRHGFAMAGAALCDRAEDLEMRIRMMTRRATRISASGVALSLGATAVAILGGCGMPAPSHPAPATNPPSVASAPTAARPSTASGASDTIAPRPRAAEGRSASGADSLAERVKSLLARLRAVNDSAQRAVGGRPDTAAAREFDALVRKLRDSADQMASLLPAASPCAESPVLHQAKDPSRIQNPAHIQARRPAGIDPCVFEALFQATVSDSAAAEAPVPACTAGAGPNDAVLIRLIVANSAMRSEGRIELDAGSATNDRTSVQLNDSKSGERTMSCDLGRSGTLRVFGAGAFGAPVIVRASGPTTIAVVTGSGRVLVAPTAVTGENHRYVLEWKAAQE